ncbi:MAG: hypothetical protein KGM18_01670 [Sphingomonadales bacterium]|nr:hypothetical protein [Sphingomonadales bacterium]
MNSLFPQEFSFSALAVAPASGLMHAVLVNCGGEVAKITGERYQGVSA